MKILLAQINPTVGDIENNSRTIIDLIKESKGNNIDLVIFPELAVTGYPPRDLLERKSFGKQSEEAISEIASYCTDKVAAIIGFVECNEKSSGKPFYNSAALCKNGSVEAVYRKVLLPSYDVFDETRWFESGERPVVFEMSGIRFGITICEDIWSEFPHGERIFYQINPVVEYARLNVMCLINISASPFTLNKPAKRIKLASEIAKKNRINLIYCNQVGGNDDLIFDGGSFAVNSNGELAVKGKEFETDFVNISIDSSFLVSGKIEKSSSVEETLWKALKLGVTDYIQKCKKKNVWIGISGGIDSALVSILASEAIGKENVNCIAMPTRFTSKASVEDAITLARNIGVNFKLVPIENIFSEILSLLSPHFEGRPFDTAEENIQSRIRGLILMAFANKFEGIVLATGNKSEIATGYCTLYGDMVGALAPIGDIFKTTVYAIANFINEKRKIIPQNILQRAPTAELRFNQTDQDTLPPYDQLDAVLKMYIEEGIGIDEIVLYGYEREMVIRTIEMVRRSEFKRKQAPLVLKVSERSFGSGRFYPIAQNYRDK